MDVWISCDSSVFLSAILATPTSQFDNIDCITIKFRYKSSGYDMQKCGGWILEVSREKESIKEKAFGEKYKRLRQDLTDSLQTVSNINDRLGGRAYMINED